MNLINEIEEITDKCIKCGFCESVCPTLPAFKYNSIYGARGRVILAGYAVNHMDEHLKLDDSFYSCLDCFACENACPVGINAGIVSELLKEAITEKTFNEKNPVAEMIKDAIIKYENPLGLKDACSEWSHGIEFDKSDTIILTGDMYQLMPYTRSMNKLRKYIDDRIVNSFSKIISKNIDIIKLSRHFYDKNLKIKMENDLRNIVYILKKSGIKFDYLGSEEPYPGMFLYDLGYINEFKKYSKNIYKSLKSRKIKTIIALDPHTYDLLKNKYPLFIKNFDINIIYYTDLINLKFKKSNEKITVQEPCHMVLHNNEYKAMDILNSLSDVKLPDRSGKTTMCCGGPDELLYPEISYNVSRKRYNDLKEISDKIVTVCPLCYNNLSYDNNVVDFSDFIKNLIINE